MSQPTPSQERFEANFSTMILSLASAAAVNLGLAPDPSTNKTTVNLDVAQFNIDLLSVLQGKTKGNLTAEEEQFLKVVLSDLQMKFVKTKGENKK